MDAIQALAFIEQHGIVLLAGKGSAPRLTEAIAGETISGSWWGHAKGKRIFTVLQDVGESPDVLFCRLLAGKITLVHRRLWPALVAASKRLPVAQLAWVQQEHTASGRHRNTIIPYPDWVPEECIAAAAMLSEDEAARQLGLDKLC
jgi:hypothetical protein